MKATEVLNRYAKGERDFRGANLRGQNFKGQDLSGANFSEADIRGTNFTNAILREAKFIGARAGVQKCWWWVQQGMAFLLSALAGFSTGLSGELIASLLFNNEGNQAYFIVGIVASGLTAITFIAIARQGFTSKALGTISTAVAIIGAGAFTVSSDSAFTFTFAFAVSVASAVVFAGVAVFASAIIGTFVGAGACAFVFVNAFTFAGIGVGVGAFTFAVASLLFGLYCSHRAFKGDENFAVIRTFGVAFGAIGGTSFCGADLTHANCGHGILNRTNFNSTKQKQTVLEWVNWQNVQKLDRARLGNSILANSAVRELLVTRDGSHKSYVDANLRTANLDGVNLEGADLTWADLTCATLRHANLKDANLAESLVLHTDFTEATMTGSCLEAWNIDSSTILEQVDCQYVYLLRNQQERRPSSGDFAPGEFTKLFQEVLSTVDLIFRNGVDWKAFVAAFQQVQVQNEDTPLEIQSIENKGDGTVVVRVSVPPDTNKA